MKRIRMAMAAAVIGLFAASCAQDGMSKETASFDKAG